MNHQRKRRQGFDTPVTSHALAEASDDLV